MKKRWFIVVVLFLCISGLLLPQLAADVHFFLSKEYGSVVINPILGWQTIMAGGKPLKMYVMLMLLTALLLLWILVSSTYLNYRSKMINVTPDIKTPCADGQGQFGTARWLPEDKFARFFGTWRVPYQNPAFQELMQAGEQDRKEIANADIRTS